MKKFKLNKVIQSLMIVAVLLPTGCAAAASGENTSRISLSVTNQANSELVGVVANETGSTIPEGKSADDAAAEVTVPGISTVDPRALIKMAATNLEENVNKGDMFNKMIQLHLFRAISEIHKSPGVMFWKDNFTLGNTGRFVYESSKRAIRSIQVISEDPRIDQDLRDNVWISVIYLVEAGKTLAELAMTNEGENLDPIDLSAYDNLEMAGKTIKAGSKEFDTGAYIKAIDRYETAWELTRNHAVR